MGHVITYHLCSPIPISSYSISTNEGIHMNAIKPCPCKDCICVPVCRHKLPFILYAECSYLKAYEPNFTFYSKRDVNLVEEIVYTLNPTRWQFRYDDYLSTVEKMIISDGEIMSCNIKVIQSDHHIFDE